MNYFVNTQSIRRWAQERLDARSRLPQVIRRLVHATVSTITKIDFPANESTQRSGFDGLVVCTEGNAWVPSGRSSWELSVEKGIKDKADRDLQKRTKVVPKRDQLETTFVFLTPRHWENKAKWAEDANGLGNWKEVRAYDADDMEQWLEQAPATAVWFAHLLGSRPGGVDDQTPTRSTRLRTLLLESMSRPALTRPHAQCPSSRADTGFLHSRTFYFSPRSRISNFLSKLGACELCFCPGETHTRADSEDSAGGRHHSITCCITT
jgi:hypothetical protein